MGPAQNFGGASRRPPDIEDYIDMLRRYRSWVIGPMFAGLVLAVVVAFLQPNVFISYATMQITPQQVSEKLLPSVMSSQQLAERLNLMETEILSRNNLIDIIQKPTLDLYKKDREKLPMDDIVQKMRERDINIIPLNTSGDRRLASAFRITFRYTDKYKASAVVRELVSRFENLNTTVLGRSAVMTNTFLADEKEKAKDRMDKLAAEVTRFETQNQGRLPQQAQSNANALMQVQMNLLQVNSAISRAEQDKLTLRTQLDNLKNEQNYVSANLETIVPGVTPISMRNEKLLNLDKLISEQKSNLAALKKSYGDNYPDIARMQAQLDSLEADKAQLEKEENARAAAAPGGAPKRVVNPQLEKQLLELQAQQKNAETQVAAKNVEVEELTRQRAQLQRQQADYQHRIDSAPLNEQQYAQLRSDLEMAKTAYQEMVKKQEMSETSQNLEEHRAGENLELLDPANVPEKAVEPNRMIWAGMGTFLGMLVGLALAAVKEVKDASLKNLKDVRAYTNLPVLSSIPLLENALLVRRKRRLVWLAWSSAIIVGITLMSGSVYYYMASS